MEDNRPTLAQYFIEQACPDNKFLEEINNVIPWLEIETWFKGHLKKEHKKTGRPSYPIILFTNVFVVLSQQDDATSLKCCAYSPNILWQTLTPSFILFKSFSVAQLSIISQINLFSFKYFKFLVT